MRLSGLLSRLHHAGPSPRRASMIDAKECMLDNLEVHLTFKGPSIAYARISTVLVPCKNAAFGPHNHLLTIAGTRHWHAMRVYFMTQALGGIAICFRG